MRKAASSSSGLPFSLQMVAMFRSVARRSDQPVCPENGRRIGCDHATPFASMSSRFTVVADSRLAPSCLRSVLATRRTSAWRAAAMSRCAPSRNTVLNKSYPSGWRSGTTIPFLGVAYPLRMLKSISTIESKQVIPPSSIHRRTPESLIPRFPRPGKLVSTIRAVRHAGSIDLRCSAMPSTQ